MNFRYCFFFFFLLANCTFIYVKAQDGHYSQYLNTPLFTNPAHIGDFTYKHRIGSAYRSQWASIAPSYTNFNVFYDQAGKVWNWGLLFNRNEAGLASLHTTNVIAGASYRKFFAAHSQTHLTLGANLGIIQRRFDPTKFSFDNQYNPDLGFDPNTQSGESFNQTTLILPDLNTGFAFCFGNGLQTKGVNGAVGLAFYHLNQPMASFFNADTVRFYRKTTFYTNFSIAVSSQLSVITSAFWSQQRQTKELLFGVMGKYRFNKSVILQTGLSVRSIDAIILEAGVVYQNLAIGFSYDATTSTLSNANNGTGALELTAMYRFGEVRATNWVAASDIDNDGVPDERDQCPSEKGIKRLKGCPPVVSIVLKVNDADNDGILDDTDACPTIAGVISNKGCPQLPVNLDTDGDGIPDKDDACPTLAGVTALNGCPFADIDGDGVRDKDDNCPTVKGEPYLRGCPVLDADGDGINDADDACPTLHGIVSLNGCPSSNSNIDTDGDGILDNVDICPTVAGTIALNGCLLLDMDGDGVIDEEDVCPTIAGSLTLKGCPQTPTKTKDKDGDGIMDSQDLCPTVAGVRILQGCPQNTLLKDSDADGVVDREDLCPFVFGTQEYRGCNDSDQDGVWDYLDICPKVFGNMQNNGCPTTTHNIDSDSDGILDNDDKCPYLRGLYLHQGCPDSDKDGVSDIEDDCPFVKGVYSNKGCPLENIVVVSPTTTTVGVSVPTAQVSIDIVEFDYNQAIVKPYYYQRLDELAAILRANALYKVVLSGHTDSEGTDMYNYALGQQRSRAVHDYLVQRGVLPSRIETVSYGEAIPKQDNANDYGKARNRRTEINILSY